MAPRVYYQNRTAPEALTAVLVDASVATATYNEASVSVTPCLSTGKHMLQFTVAGLTGTSIAAKLQHSWDNVNWADVASGGLTTAVANGTTFTTVPGPVAPFVRIALTYTAVTAATVTVNDFVAAK